MSHDILIQLTADIVSAHVSNNLVAPEEMAGFIESVFAALSTTANAPSKEMDKAAPVPAVSIRASVKADYIVCLEDGVKKKTLKRHIQTAHNLTPAEYRAKWGLPNDYPLIAPNYSQTRREVALAREIGRKEALEPIAEPAPASVAKRGRPKKVIVEPVQAPNIEAPAADAEAIEAPAKPARKPRTKKGHASNSG